MTTQSVRTLSNAVAHTGITQQHCTNFNAPIIADYCMMSGSSSDSTSGHFQSIDSNMPNQPQSDNESTHTQPDSAVVLRDSNSSHNISSCPVLNESASPVINLNFSESLEKAKSTLKIKELKQFQISCIMAIQEGKDVVLVQPASSGKSVCFVLPTLLNPISLVVEPVVAVITNQVDALQKKGIDAVALGNAAGNADKSPNF